MIRHSNVLWGSSPGKAWTSGAFELLVRKADITISRYHDITWRSSFVTFDFDRPRGDHCREIVKESTVELSDQQLATA
jgi:hypothetical protein